MGFGNGKQSIPEVFQLIIENDNEQDAIRAKGEAMTIQDWVKLKKLRKYRRESLVPAAEKILRWNTDKGKAV